MRSSSSSSDGGVPPKGCMVVRVGAEQQRFVVPVVYLNHPLFLRLLKEAEEEYGFEHGGAIMIPCHVEHFRHVQGIIDKESGVPHNHHHHHHSHHHHHHHHQSLQFHRHLNLSGCFKA